MPSPKTETSGRRMDASGLSVGSDLRFPETFLTYLLHVHNSLVLHCCHAAQTYGIWLIIRRKICALTDLWAKF